MIPQLLVRAALALTLGWAGWAAFAQEGFQPPYTGIISLALAALLITPLYKIGALGAAAYLGYTAWTDFSVQNTALFLIALALALPWEKKLTPAGIVKHYKDLVRGKHKKH